ncbi:MAG: protein kinase, partial [Arenibacter algicola]|nr:protein kinase [Arenibacter algicola]
ASSKQSLEIKDITLTEAGKVQGTAHYMSPEQIERDPAIDHRSDIFSLGAVIYEILCGQTPAQGEKLHEVIESVRDVVPPRPSSISKIRIPQLLEEVAMKCLAKDPADRYQSMAEVILLLQQDWRYDLAPGS